tara:strand:- start:565 stop:1236 length:672 start_codon:yes stop_codon:yes gene_type:complete
LEILFEDNHLIIINKKPGELSQGDKTNDPTLSEKVKIFLKERDKKKGNVFLGIIHRLDRPTSGIIIFSKTSKALSRMSEQFKKHEVSKTYWAVTKKMTKKSGRLENYLLKNQSQNKSYVCIGTVNRAKLAILSFKKILDLKNFSLLSVNLETGRHHQIRTQFSQMGYPIKGDLKYGYKRPNKNKSIHLHSRKISFIHPVSKKMVEIIANPPKDEIWNLCLSNL